MTAAHSQTVDHRYSVHYPEHAPRKSDPHYQDFRKYKRNRKTEGTYHCDFAAKYRNGDFSECDGQIECHHAHIEFAVQNGVDLSLLEKDYPGVSKQEIGAWVESAANLELLCTFHHRGHGGTHVASQSDYEGEKYVKNLLS